jgi:hypothetical protein
MRDDPGAFAGGKCPEVAPEIAMADLGQTT